MATKTSSKQSSPKPVKKERGWLLTLLLVLIILNGIFAAYLFYTLRLDNAALDRPWVLTLMVIHSLMNVIAAAGIWFWQKWGLYLYAASTVLGIAVGLISVGAWSVFYMILPLAVLGWVLRSKWPYFGLE